MQRPDQHHGCLLSVSVRVEQGTRPQTGRAVVYAHMCRVCRYGAGVSCRQCSRDGRLDPVRWSYAAYRIGLRGGPRAACRPAPDATRLFFFRPHMRHPVALHFARAFLPSALAEFGPESGQGRLCQLFRPQLAAMPSWVGTVCWGPWWGAGVVLANGECRQPLL